MLVAKGEIRPIPLAEGGTGQRGPSPTQQNTFKSLGPVELQDVTWRYAEAAVTCLRDKAPVGDSMAYV